MTEAQRKLIEHLLDKERWSDILQRFIDVLRINIFLVDDKGRPLLTPCKGRYGWNILEMSPIGMDLLSESSSMLTKFKQHGFYLEYNYPFDLHNFAVPIRTDDNHTIGYLVIGPVILNKRLESEQYREIAKSLSMDPQILVDAINGVRTMSFVGIKSILDLLDEVARYTIHLKSQKAEISKIQFKTKVLSKEINKEAQDLLSSIYMDELLMAFLDMALKMTKTECGSVMVLNKNKGELTIKVSRGIEKNVVEKTRVKLGEGISGIAAQDNATIVIHGTETTNNRIRPLLKRPDIKHSFITPLASQDKIFGVLNLHTKSDDTSLPDDSLEAVNMLSTLTSVAINSLQQTIPMANPQ